MLVGGSKDIEISFGEIQADEHQGSAHWEASYTYSATSRKVQNVVNAQFRFQEGHIILHQDTFFAKEGGSEAGMRYSCKMRDQACFLRFFRQ